MGEIQLMSRAYKGTQNIATAQFLVAKTLDDVAPLQIVDRFVSLHTMRLLSMAVHAQQWQSLIYVLHNCILTKTINKVSLYA